MVTVIFAVILTLGLQIDSLDIIKSLSTDVELRTLIIKGVDQTLEGAGTILLTKSITVEALKSLKNDFDDLKNVDIPSDLTTRSQGLAWIAEKFKDSSDLDKIEKAYIEKI